MPQFNDLDIEDALDLADELDTTNLEPMHRE